MAEITAAAVGKLREMTNAGMMDCKKALTEAKGDLTAAVDILRKKGAATTSKIGGREAQEGLIARYIAPGARVGGVGGVNWPTDFVGGHQKVQDFADEVARRLAADEREGFEAEG